MYITYTARIATEFHSLRQKSSAIAFFPLSLCILKHVGAATSCLNMAGGIFGCIQPLGHGSHGSHSLWLSEVCLVRKPEVRGRAAVSTGHGWKVRLKWKRCIYTKPCSQRIQGRRYTRDSQSDTDLMET